MPFGSKRIRKARCFPNGSVEPTEVWNTDPFTGVTNHIVTTGYEELPPPETMELKTLLRNKIDLKEVGTKCVLGSADPLAGLSMNPVKATDPEPWDESLNNETSKKDN